MIRKPRQVRIARHRIAVKERNEPALKDWITLGFWLLWRLKRMPCMPFLGASECLVQRGIPDESSALGAGREEHEGLEIHRVHSLP